jgi:hypothetical protein
MRFAACLVALHAMAATAAAAQPAAAANPAEARDSRPLLWNGLRAGMSAREVYAALRAQHIRARLARDPANGREFVETPGETIWAGRPYLIALGFVHDGLFYIDINSQRTLPGRIPFERAHFSQVARLLTGQYGAPIQISPAPVISDAGELGLNTEVSGRFERGGVRADLKGYDLYASFMRDVVETVSVRFWRTVDAQTFAASQPPLPPPKQPNRQETSP